MKYRPNFFTYVDVYEAFIVDLIWAFVLLLIKVLFGAESEEEALKSAGSWLLGLRNGKRKGP